MGRQTLLALAPDLVCLTLFGGVPKTKLRAKKTDALINSTGRHRFPTVAKKERASLSPLFSQLLEIDTQIGLSLWSHLVNPCFVAFFPIYSDRHLFKIDIFYI